MTLYLLLVLYMVCFVIIQELAPSNAGPIWCLCRCASQQLLAVSSAIYCFCNHEFLITDYHMFQHMIQFYILEQPP
jgi:hypothetical protein